MKPVLKVGLVVAGYAAAFAIASTAVAVRITATSGPDAQASSGMYAFGDAVLSCAVFTVSGLVPTATALFFLRPYPRFWSVLSALCLIIAFTGIVAAVVFTLGRHLPPSPLGTAAQLSVLRLLAAPLLALSVAACAVFCPARSSRLTLLASTFIEAAVSTYAGYIWFVPVLFHR